jgi:hypothetical protein
MATPRGVVAPNLPIAPATWDQRFQDQFANVLRLYFNQISNRINAPTPHASYFDTTTQANPVANAVNLFTYNSVVSDYEVTRGVYIWPRVNGANLPDSATKIVIDGPNSEIVAAWNFVLVLKAEDYFELAWESSDTNVVIPYVAASGNIPAIPSIILTVSWVSNYGAAIYQPAA